MEIKYMEKPEWVSWDAILECLRAAHKVNEKRGLHMSNQDLDAEHLQDKFKNAFCFVALDDIRVVGTFGLKIFRGNRWWSWNKKVAYNCMDGILPEYQGTDVFFGLDKMRKEYTKRSGADIIQSNTAEKNVQIRKMAKVKKYKDVQYSATGKGANYYSIIAVKWLHGCPYPDWFIKFMFNLSKIVVKTLWKPGYVRRFWFN